MIIPAIKLSFLNAAGNFYVLVFMIYKTVKLKNCKKTELSYKRQPA